MTVSNRSLIMLADALRRRRRELRTTWRRLDAGRQALLVLAHLREGETYRDLALRAAVGHHHSDLADPGTHLLTALAHG